MPTQTSLFQTLRVAIPAIAVVLVLGAGSTPSVEAQQTIPPECVNLPQAEVGKPYSYWYSGAAYYYYYGAGQSINTGTGQTGYYMANPERSITVSIDGTQYPTFMGREDVQYTAPSHTFSSTGVKYTQIVMLNSGNSNLGGGNGMSRVSFQGGTPTGSGQTQPANCFISVVAASQPDLTTGGITPTSAMTNTLTTFSATVSNMGAGSVASSFVNKFQLATDSSGTGATDIGTHTVSGGVAANNSVTTSLSYAFTSPGTYYMRACADSSSQVSESNENNNCGAWTPITVSATSEPNVPICVRANVGQEVLMSYSGGPDGICGSGGPGDQCSSGVSIGFGDGTPSVSTPTGQNNLQVYHAWPAVAEYLVYGSGPAWGNRAGYGGAGSGTITGNVGSASGAGQPARCRAIISPVSQADLVAGATSVSGAAAGSASTFTAPATNSGDGSSGSFPMLFQVSENGALVNSPYTGALAPAASVSMSAPYTFPSAGTYNVRACANYDTAWQKIFTPESNYDNNCGPWTTVTIPAAAQPDLTAGSVSPSNATAGVAVALSASITNGGQAGTATGFTDLFQRATDVNGANATDIGTYPSAALAAGSGNTASASYTFPSAATWYVRACADKSSAGDAGGVPESNEGNNCGPWTVIHVCAADETWNDSSCVTTQQPPITTPTLSCNVSPATLPSTGGSVTYTASGSGASAPFTWDDALGGTYGTGSTVTRSIPAAKGTYAMTVSKSGYTPDTCYVTVGAGACTNPSATITADPTRVRSGDTSTLSYSATGVDTGCVITGPNGFSHPITPNSCNVAPATLGTPAIDQQSVFRISCDNGESSAQVIINLIPRFIEF